MQITATGLFLALLTGLLGVWLFITMSQTQHGDYRVQEARLACDQATFGVEFAGKNATTDMIQKQVRACAEFDKQSGQRAIAEEQADKEKTELKGSIERAITSRDDQASKSELAVRQAASAVASAIKK